LRFAAPLGVAVIVLLAVVDLASLAARLEFQVALRARPWGTAFPILALAGFVAAVVLCQRGRPKHAYLASSGALLAAMATAAVGIFPNILPARDPSHGLPIYDAAASADGLAAALWWWIPGMLLVTGYFVFIHTHSSKFSASHLPPSRDHRR
jgi:cytochrome bd-type quinol oxidase subunit 2